MKKTYLKRLDKSPQQYSNGVSLSQQLDEARSSEQS